MKKHSISLALLAFVAISHAQTNSEATGAAPAPAVKDSNATTFIQANVVPTTERVNPFRGTPLSAEQLQKQLELSKLQTQLLEEQLRNAGLQEDLKNMPTRKRAEISQAETQIAREETQRATLTRDARVQALSEQSTREEEAARKRQEAESRKAATRQEAEAAKRRKQGGSSVQAGVPVEVAGDAATPVRAAPPRVEVLSVMQVDNKRTALLSMNGGVAAVQDGEQIGAGRVTITANGDVLINGARQPALHGATLARVQAEPGLAQAQAGSGSTSMTPASGATGIPPGWTPASSLQVGTQAPPLPVMSVSDNGKITKPVYVPPPVPGSASNR